MKQIWKRSPLITLKTVASLLLLSHAVSTIECNSTCRSIFPNCTMYWKNPDPTNPEFICQNCDDYLDPSLKIYSFQVNEISNGLPTTPVSNACVAGIYPIDQSLFPNCTSMGSIRDKSTREVTSYNCLECEPKYASSGQVPYNASAPTYEVCTKISSYGSIVLFSGLLVCMGVIVW